MPIFPDLARPIYFTPCACARGNNLSGVPEVKGCVTGVLRHMYVMFTLHTGIPRPVANYIQDKVIARSSAACGSIYTEPA